MNTGARVDEYKDGVVQRRRELGPTADKRMNGERTASIEQGGRRP